MHSQNYLLYNIQPTGCSVLYISYNVQYTVLSLQCALTVTDRGASGWWLSDCRCHCPTHYTTHWPTHYTNLYSQTSILPTHFKKCLCSINQSNVVLYSKQCIKRENFFSDIRNTEIGECLPFISYSPFLCWQIRSYWNVLLGPTLSNWPSQPLTN